jgi:hypothetical protein
MAHIIVWTGQMRMGVKMWVCTVPNYLQTYIIISCQPVIQSDDSKNIWKARLLPEERRFEWCFLNGKHGVSKEGIQIGEHCVPVNDTCKRMRPSKLRVYTPLERVRLWQPRMVVCVSLYVCRLFLYNFEHHGELFSQHRNKYKGNSPKQRLKISTTNNTKWLLKKSSAKF